MNSSLHPAAIARRPCLGRWVVVALAVMGLCSRAGLLRAQTWDAPSRLATPSTAPGWVPPPGVLAPSTSAGAPATAWPAPSHPWSAPAWVTPPPYEPLGPPVFDRQPDVVRMAARPGPLTTAPQVAGSSSAGPTAGEQLPSPAGPVGGAMRIDAYGAACGPGFLPSLGRFRGLSPVAPNVVSAHAAPWDVLPTPAELQGGTLRVAPHCHDPCAVESPYSSGDFSPDPVLGSFCWDTTGELSVYGGKTPICGAKPICNRGLPFYERGEIPPSLTFLGWTNPVQPKFYVYGDFRTAVATNRDAGNSQSIWASRLNLEIDFWLTATERFHAFWGPLDEGQQFNSIVVNSGEMEIEEHFDGWDENTDTMFLEGDLGYLLGGWQGIDAPFDLPFAAGLVPLLFQNGVWLEDAFVGAAATIPARNNPVLDWSNFDTTVFFGFKELTTGAFPGDDEANFVGLHTFIDRRGGYLEAGWAFVEDPTDQGLSYHNVAVSYTRRYLNKFSNAVRLITNFGQEGNQANRTADGFVVLIENSFLTRNPYRFVPYCNLFAGFDNPQPLGRLAGVLRNTGINFETDFLTGYPRLDDTANNTYGGAVGLDFLLGRDFGQQVIFELATVQTFGSDVGRNAAGDQYAVGMRYQLAISNTWIFRSDAMYGFLENADDISGLRAELRRKF